MVLATSDCMFEMYQPRSPWIGNDPGGWYQAPEEQPLIKYPSVENFTNHSGTKRQLSQDYEYNPTEIKRMTPNRSPLNSSVENPGSPSVDRGCSPASSVSSLQCQEYPSPMAIARNGFPCQPEINSDFDGRNADFVTSNLTSENESPLNSNNLSQRFFESPDFNQMSGTTHSMNNSLIDSSVTNFPDSPSPNMMIPESERNEYSLNNHYQTRQPFCGTMRSTLTHNPYSAPEMGFQNYQNRPYGIPPVAHQYMTNGPPVSPLFRMQFPYATYPAYNPPPPYHLQLSAFHPNAPPFFRDEFAKAARKPFAAGSVGFPGAPPTPIIENISLGDVCTMKDEEDYSHYVVADPDSLLPNEGDKELVTNLLLIESKLCFSLLKLKLSDPVMYIYNPLDYARHIHQSFILRYGANKKKVLFLGMNPGPFGMAQNGIPFGDSQFVKNFLKVDKGVVSKPSREHPKRPVWGLDCPQREVSGSRFWSLIQSLSGTPEAFFQNCYVYNYCPLVFLGMSGKNITPPSLASSVREPLLTACDKALIEVVDLLGIEKVVAVGRFVEERSKLVLKTAGKDHVNVVFIMHPSPINPKANAGWETIVRNQLDEAGLSSFFPHFENPLQVAFASSPSSVKSRSTSKDNEEERATVKSENSEPSSSEEKSKPDMSNSVVTSGESSTPEDVMKSNLKKISECRSELCVAAEASTIDQGFIKAEVTLASNGAVNSLNHHNRPSNGTDVARVDIKPRIDLSEATQHQFPRHISMHPLGQEYGMHHPAPSELPYGMESQHPVGNILQNHMSQPLHHPSSSQLDSSMRHFPHNGHIQEYPTGYQGSFFDTKHGNNQYEFFAGGQVAQNIHESGHFYGADYNFGGNEGFCHPNSQGIALPTVAMNHEGALSNRQSPAMLDHQAVDYHHSFQSSGASEFIGAPFDNSSGYAPAAPHVMTG